MTDKLRAIHPSDGLRPGGWYACLEPGRDIIRKLTAFDPRCESCNAILARIQGQSEMPVVMESRTATGVELGTTSTARGRLARADERRRS